MNFINRQIAQACRCQRLTGSYTNKSRSCECESIYDCVFHELELAELKNNPKVMKALKRNWDEFDNMKEDNHGNVDTI